jgi:hypothetical protein
VCRKPCPTTPASPRSSTNSSHRVASCRVAVVFTPPRGPTSRRASLALNRQSLQRRAQQLDDWHRTPSPALGLLGDQAAAAWVRLPPNGQQPTNEVDVTHLQSGHLSDPQCCRRQDHHAVTPGPITTPLHGFRDQPAQRAHVRQGGADRPTTRRPSPILRQGCAPAARRAPPRPAPALGPRSCS